MLFHVSEKAGIEKFEPRSSEYVPEPVVWAIEATRLCNYLVPRDCPRVTYYAGPQTTQFDVERFLGSARAVVAVESKWLDQLRQCRLFCYHMPSQTFECLDECAGYYVSRVPVIPESVEIIEDALAALLKHGVGLRFPPSLWPLRDAVVESSLKFSIIRMRNAQPLIELLNRPSEIFKEGI